MYVPTPKITRVLCEANTELDTANVRLAPSTRTPWIGSRRLGPSDWPFRLGSVGPFPQARPLLIRSLSSLGSGLLAPPSRIGPSDWSPRLRPLGLVPRIGPLGSALSDWSLLLGAFRSANLGRPIPLGLSDQPAWLCPLLIGPPNRPPSDRHPWNGPLANPALSPRLGPSSLIHSQAASAPASTPLFVWVFVRFVCSLVCSFVWVFARFLAYLVA